MEMFFSEVRRAYPKLQPWSGLLIGIFFCVFVLEVFCDAMICGIETYLPIYSVSEYLFLGGMSQ